MSQPERYFVHMTMIGQALGLAAGRRRCDIRVTGRPGHLRVRVRVWREFDSEAEFKFAQWYGLAVPWSRRLNLKFFEHTGRDRCRHRGGRRPRRRPGRVTRHWQTGRAGSHGKLELELRNAGGRCQAPARRG